MLLVWREWLIHLVSVIDSGFVNGNIWKKLTFSWCLPFFLNLNISNGWIQTNRFKMHKHNIIRMCLCYSVCTNPMSRRWKSSNVEIDNSFNGKKGVLAAMLHAVPVLMSMCCVSFHFIYRINYWQYQNNIFMQSYIFTECLGHIWLFFLSQLKRENRRITIDVFHTAHQISDVRTS